MKNAKNVICKKGIQDRYLIDIRERARHSRNKQFNFIEKKVKMEGKEWKY